MAIIARFFTLFLVVAALQGCVTTGGASGFSAGGDTRFVEVFLPQQTPVTDRITEGKNANEYLLPLWDQYAAGRVPGARADVELFFWHGNGAKETLGVFSVNGHLPVSINRNRVDAGTSLCVRVPWQIIAHQRIQADANVMCTVPGDMDRYFSQGMGRTPNDTFAIVAIAPAGI